MNTKPVPPRFIRVVTAAVVSLLCAVIFVQNNTSQAFAESELVPGDSSANSEAQGADDGRIVVDFDLSRVTLIEGRLLAVAGVADSLQTEVEGRASDAVRLHAGGVGDTRATFAYRISMLGQPTDYWVRFDVWNLRGHYNPCSIWHGAPEADGVIAATSPFRCGGSSEQQGRRFTRQTYSVELNNDAESSGTILPLEVSLTDGTFRTDLSYHHVGDVDIPLGQKSAFDAVLLVGDTPFYERQARMEFAYQIVDDGRKTGVWVAGLATNHRGEIKFNSDGRCALYAGNPLEGKGRLDTQKPLENSDYYCSAEGRFVHGPNEGGNIHFDATYFIGTR